MTERSLAAEITDRAEDSRIISLTGGGGKTSLLCLLVAHFRKEGLSVLASTTTKMQDPAGYPYPVDRVFLDDRVLSYKPESGEAVFWAEPCSPEKVKAPEREKLLTVSSFYDKVILEADGARRLPLKKHTERDPVILKGSFTIAVMGLSALGKRREDACFGEEGEGVVDAAYLQNLIDDPAGALKGGARLLVLNQWDAIGEAERKEALLLAAPVPILYASVQNDACYGCSV